MGMYFTSKSQMTTKMTGSFYTIGVEVGVVNPLDAEWGVIVVQRSDFELFINAIVSETTPLVTPVCNPTPGLVQCTLSQWTDFCDKAEALVEAGDWEGLSSYQFFKGRVFTHLEVYDWLNAIRGAQVIWETLHEEDGLTEINFA